MGTAELPMSNLPNDQRRKPWDAGCVLGVAIINDQSGIVHFMPPPARHDSIIKALVESGVPAPIGPAQRYRQGFMTVSGFMDRERAAKLVGHHGLLTSEDLW
jgi:hypothetical protein